MENNTVEEVECTVSEEKGKSKEELVEQGCKPPPKPNKKEEGEFETQRSTSTAPQECLEDFIQNVVRRMESPLDLLQREAADWNSRFATNSRLGLLSDFSEETEEETDKEDVLWCGPLNRKSVVLRSAAAKGFKPRQDRNASPFLKGGKNDDELRITDTGRIAQHTRSKEPVDSVEPPSAPVPDPEGPGPDPEPHPYPLTPNGPVVRLPDTNQTVSNPAGS